MTYVSQRPSLDLHGASSCLLELRERAPFLRRHGLRWQVLRLIECLVEDTANQTGGRDVFRMRISSICFTLLCCEACLKPSEYTYSTYGSVWTRTTQEMTRKQCCAEAAKAQPQCRNLAAVTQTHPKTLITTPKLRFSFPELRELSKHQGGSKSETQSMRLS